MFEALRGVSAERVCAHPESSSGQAPVTPRGSPPPPGLFSVHPEVPLAGVLPYVKACEVAEADLLAQHALGLVLKNPWSHLGDVLLHHGGSGAHHPAVFGAGAYLFAHAVGLFAEPDFFEGLCLLDVAHALLPIAGFKTVAGVYFAPGVRKEIHGAGFAGQGARITLDVVDETQVEECTEPCLGVVFLEKLIGQLFQVAAEFLFIADKVVFFMEVKAVVECGGSELEVHALGQFVEGNQVIAVPVAERLSKTDIFHAHLVERPERPHSLFKAIVTAAQKIVCLFQTFNAHADADVGKFFGKLDGTVDPPAACAYHDAWRLSEHHFNDVFQILADKRFAAGNVRELEVARKNLQIPGLDFFRFFGRVLPNVAHLAAHLTAVSGNHRHIGGHLDTRIFAVFARHWNSLLFFLNHQKRSALKPGRSRFIQSSRRIYFIFPRCFLINQRKIQVSYLFRDFIPVIAFPDYRAVIPDFIISQSGFHLLGKFVYIAESVEGVPRKRHLRIRRNIARDNLQVVTHGFKEHYG